MCCLQVLLEQAGFEVLERGQWGNQLYEQHVLSTHTWAGSEQVYKLNAFEVYDQKE